MPAPYAPFLDPRTARPPGLSPLDPAAWLCVDADYAAQVAERDALFAGDDAADLTGALPEGADALAEFSALLLDWLTRDPRWTVTPDSFRRPDGVSVPRSLPPLALTGRLIQEDVLLLAPAEPEYRLVAGVLCFPSRWRLADKLGRPLTAIHGPVPGYADHLSARVNRVFAAIRPEAPLVRINWLVHPTDILRQPLAEGANAPAEWHTGRWCLRTERQTLRRLPRTCAVVFTVKTTLTPVGELSPEQRTALHAALSRWSADEIAYRGGEGVWRAALAAVAGQGVSAGA